MVLLDASKYANAFVRRRMLFILPAHQEHAERPDETGGIALARRNVARQLSGIHCFLRAEISKTAEIVEHGRRQNSERDQAHAQVTHSSRDLNLMNGFLDGGHMSRQWSAR